MSLKSTKSYPRVLIFSQTFNKISGGGITLTNLFFGYPRENIAVLTYPFMLLHASFESCINYYQLGREEYFWSFPLNYIKKKFNSGPVQIEKKNSRITANQPYLRNRIATNILSPFLRWSGLTHCVSRIKISDRLKKWLEEYKPEVLYLQISNRESILYSLELIEYLKIPAAIHMMDDWPMTVSSRGPFRKYWHNRIDREFRELLAKTTSYLSISDAMSEEYLNRYGKQFKAFHNPVDPSWFNEDPVTNESDKRYFRVLYLGRIGIANESSLLAFSEFISNYIYQDCIVEFDVYTKDIDSKIARRIGNLKGVRINLPVNHEDVPSLMTRYQLLLLPLDFTRSGLKFSRLSMPSKTSEYMLSGTPIMVMAPAESAVSKFCTYNKCAHCISSDKLEDLTKTMNFLIENDDYRKDLASGAKRLANQLFNRRKVTRDFRDFLVTLSSFK